MPRVNRVCDVVMGMGDGRVPLTVNGVTPPALVGVRAAGAQWWKLKTLAYQRMDDAGHTDDRTVKAWFEALDIGTGQTKTLAMRGASTIVAFDDVWAIWLNRDPQHPDAPHGYLDCFGRERLPGVRVEDDWVPLAAVGGKLYIKRKYHSFDETIYSWDGFALLPVPRIPPRYDWEVGHVPGYGLSAWPVGDQTSGVWLSRDSYDFHPDICVLPSGNIMVVSSETTGEGWSDGRRYTVDLANAVVWAESAKAGTVTMPLTRTDLTQPVFVDPDPPCVVPEFQVPNHPIRVAVFGEPGFNLATGDARHDDVEVAPWGVFCTLGRDDLKTKEASARVRGVPLFAYTDGLPFDPAGLLTGVTWPRVIATFQAYPLDWQDMRLRAQEIEDAAVREDADEAALCVAAYRQIAGDGAYSWTVCEVLELLALSWELACRRSEITHVLVFHQNRADGKDGVVSRPEFVEAVRRLKAAAAAYQPEPPAPVRRDTLRSFMPFPKIVGVLIDDRMPSVEPGHTNVEMRDGLTVATAWQKLELTERADKRILGRFISADLRLCVNDAGEIETRPLSSEGSFEVLVGGTAPSGEDILIRACDIGKVKPAAILKVVGAEA